MKKYVMKYKKRRWYLKGIYNDYETARREGRKYRNKTNSRYRIERKGIFGGYELWLTAKAYQ